MRRNGSLTGGTVDVSPQFMHLSATQSAADTTTTTSFPIPVQRLPQNRGVQVMEVLKVYFMTANATVETDNIVEAYLSTKNFGTTAIGFSEPSVIAAYTRDIRITTSGQILAYEPITMDLTDSAGHGVLVATDNIFLQVQSTGTSQSVNILAKVLYRWKNIGDKEFFGILAGQQ